MSDDIVLYDPHYPYPDMSGIAAVREGLTAGTAVVVETSTHHVLHMGGKRLDFPQVFIIDTDGERITKMRVYEPYEPYGPHGSTGFGLKTGHTVRRLSHRRAASSQPASAQPSR